MKVASASTPMANRPGRSLRKQPLKLPIIAPKKGLISPNAVFDLPTTTKAPNRQHRIRFPPRSRTGCWYEIVKCDELRPQCNQCVRLGHVCDYRPRLCFRDDTRRVRERMPDVRTTGNTVWDPNFQTTQKRPCPITPSCDLLPPFVMLTSDEERERKAQTSIPGTYHVVAVPESFSQLPEYTDGSSEGDQGNISVLEIENCDSAQAECGDWAYGPDVVVLNSFKYAKRQLFTDRRSSPLSPESDQASFTLSAASISETVPEYSDNSLQHTHGNPEPGHYAMALFEHFRNFVYPQLIPRDGMFNSHGLDVEVFENEASRFPPLYRAIMAISALSIVRQGSGEDVDASYHYSQVISFSQGSLYSNEDILSDGLYLTHFLLLIYEIVAAKPSSSNLWSHHISQLLHLTLLRRSISRVERFPFIIWWVSQVDLYSLFSGTGAGEFVRAVLDNQLLGELHSLFFPTSSNGSTSIYADEHGSLPTIVRLYHDTFTLAVRLGFLVEDSRRARGSYFGINWRSQQQEAKDLHDVLIRLWDDQEVRFMFQNHASLPQQSQNILQQLSILFHTCLLLFHTSLLPEQRLVPEEEVHHHATRILQMASTIVDRGREGDRWFIIFPVFVSGAVATSSGLKMMALELLSNLEEQEMGYSVSTTCQMLQAVYERQIQHSGRGGHALDVDWTDLLAEHGFQLVNYG
ncbi:hypothetical protein BO71DRAFT_325475 [Aspergillus ellipticus CBS 707.79]|uniref:Zn(2)-C6 fungal-type domain-containing protein n=1 Tax=Aspergillus ellipticus CBS 707.79 TaxID=1448320 RepID=A0A319DB45_9EURO|nr:hypothetical protein BO71DRAFT_325475 [Aspergillus ellipticus CBS 707.79]